MNENTKLEKKLDELYEVFNGVIERLEEISGGIDLGYNDLVEELGKGTTINKRERKKKALEIVKTKLPKFVKLLDEIDLMSDGMEMRIQETIDKLEEKKDKIGEIQELQDQIEDLKNEID